MPSFNNNKYLYRIGSIRVLYNASLTVIIVRLLNIIDIISTYLNYVMLWFIYDMFHLMSVPRSVQGTMEEVKNMEKYDYELTGLYSWTGLGQRNWSEVYL